MALKRHSLAIGYNSCKAVFQAFLFMGLMIEFLAFPVSCSKYIPFIIKQPFSYHNQHQAREFKHFSEYDQKENILEKSINAIEQIGYKSED